MIVLSDDFAPNGAKVSGIDFGFLQRPALGGALRRVNRPGARFLIELSWPTMLADDARVLVQQLTAAKFEGLRVAFPLQGVSQGDPGTAIQVDGSAGGTSLPLRGLWPGYVVQQGYWLTAIDSAGVHYLYQVAANVEVNSAGKAAVTVTPMLRAPLVDGNTVLLARPLIEGAVTEEIGWELSPGQLISGIGCVIEEAA